MNTHPSSSADLTPREFNKLHKDAVKLYCDAVWNLADVLNLGKDKFGRKALIEMSCLPKNKIDWFIAVSELTYRTSQIPELHYETCGVKRGRKWLLRAKEDGLKPTALRQMIRESQSEYQRKPKTLETAQWLKALMVAELELKNFNGDKSKAAERLKPLVELYSSFVSGSSC